MRRSRFCASIRSSTRRSAALLIGSTRAARANRPSASLRNARSRWATCPGTTGSADARGERVSAAASVRNAISSDAAMAAVRNALAARYRPPVTNMATGSTSRGPLDNRSAFCTLPMSISVPTNSRNVSSVPAANRVARSANPRSRAASTASRSGWDVWTRGARRGASGCDSSMSWSTTAAGDGWRANSACARCGSNGVGTSPSRRASIGAPWAAPRSNARRLRRSWCAANTSSTLRACSCHRYSVRRCRLAVRPAARSMANTSGVSPIGSIHAPTRERRRAKVGRSSASASASRVSRVRRCVLRPCARATSAISRTGINQLSQQLDRYAGFDSSEPASQRVVDHDRTVGGFDDDAGSRSVIDHQLCTLVSRNRRL